MLSNHQYSGKEPDFFHSSHVFIYLFHVETVTNLKDGAGVGEQKKKPKKNESVLQAGPSPSC